MSHIVTAETVMGDPDCIESAVKDLVKENEGWKYLGQGKFNVFSKEVEGIGISLPGWSYPVVVQADGSILYDNYKGAWGKQSVLHQLQQQYAAQAVMKAGRMNGRRVTGMIKVKETGHIQIQLE